MFLISTERKLLKSFLILVSYYFVKQIHFDFIFQSATQLRFADLPEFQTLFSNLH